MDWSKAKTILIVTLLLLNIFLLTMIIFTNTTGLFTNNYNRYAKDYLSSRDIKINTDIPSCSGSAEKIIYTAKEYNLEKLCKKVFGDAASCSSTGSNFYIENGEESINLSENMLIITDKLSDGKELFSRPERLKERLVKYLEDLDFSKKNIASSEIEDIDGTKEIKFYLKYKNNFVFDQEITAKLSDDGLLTLWAPTKNVNEGNGANEILPAHQILVMGGLSPGTSIEGIDFGYKQISEGDIYGNPVWRVIMDDETVLFYNAYTGVKLY